MKRKELEKIGKQLLPNLPHFTVKGPLLFIQPLTHTLRAIYFDTSGFEPRSFYVEVFMQPFFVPADHLGFNCGWRLGGNARTWNADAPNLILELTASLQREAIPFLSNAESPEDVAIAVKSLNRSADPYVLEVIAYAFARAGDVSKGVEGLDRLLRLLDVEKSWPWQREMAQRAVELRRDLLDNPPVAEKRLKDWEIETIRNLGLEKYLCSQC